MTPTSATQSRPCGAVRAHAVPRIWGQTAAALHARFWAARGFAVVIPGGPAVATADRGPWLLLEDAHLVVADLPGHLLGHRTRPLGTRAVTVIDVRAASCREQVRADADGRLQGIDRAYAPPDRHTRTLIVTDDVDLARRWQATDPRQGAARRRRLARRARGRHRRAGTIFAPDDLDAVDQATLALLGSLASSRDVMSELDVEEVRPGVWVGSTVVLPASATVVAPVWIGDHVTIPEHASIVGPCLYRDRTVGAASSDAVRPRSDTELWTMPRRRPPSPRLERIVNSAFATVALLITAPLFPLIALAIWFEDGRPVFFRQERQTVGGRLFPCRKFRTMCRDAEAHRATLESRNICDGPQFHIEEDPRLLRVGRLIRRFHLDELPQFLDVLTGSMNVVGPRPSPEHENQCCPAWREARLSVRPGMTGLWQVARTRSPQSDFQEWIRYDLEYVERRSLRLDAWIVWRTMVNIAGAMWRATLGLCSRRRPATSPHATAPSSDGRRMRAVSTLDRLRSDDRTEDDRAAA